MSKITYDDVFKKLGIATWHQKGYYGQGISIGSLERVLHGVFNDVLELKQVTTNSDWTSHGTSVMEILTKVCPKAKRVSIYSGTTIVKGELKGDCIDYLKNNNVDIITTSRFSDGMSKSAWMDLWQDLYNKNTFLCCAAGNNGEDDGDTQELGYNDIWKLIGACDINFKRCYYSSYGQDLDFMSISNFYTTWDNKKKEGTSFSSPLFAGMIGLIQCFFKAKTGNKLSNDKLVQFIKDNCLDLGAQDRDNYYGYGLLILPDPDSIDISRYMEVPNMVINLKIGSNIATVDGKDIILDQEPIIMNNRTLVPLRFIAENLGCNVEWDGLTHTITIIKE